jgi:hypothetical protein
MKSIFTILTLFISLLSYCQSSVEQRNPVYQTSFESLLILNNSSIEISRYKSPTINEITLILNAETEACTAKNGITLTLFSGEKLYFDTILVACNQLETEKYKLSSSFILTPDLYNKLSQTEIVEFTLGDVIIPVHFKEKGENLRGLFKFSESY